MPLRNLSVIIFTAIISLICYEKAPRNRYANIMSESMQIIERNYVEEVDPRDLFENAMKGLLGGLDENSSYIGPDYFQQFQESLDQEFGGVGIMVEGPPRKERLTVLSTVRAAPAAKAGMQAGDVIFKIDEVDTEGMTLEGAVKLMRGAPGSVVHLMIQRKGHPELLPFEIKREIIPIESVLGDTLHANGNWNYFLEEHQEIGYVRLTTFGENTVRELKKALLFKDHGVDALIIDLRGNSGGLLNAAVSICDLFIDSGRIVSIRGRGGEVLRVHQAKPNSVVPQDLPIVVLVNQFSASASEIVAACLQDHRRAVVVGQRSYGKGTVQNIIELEGGQSALRLTTVSYWRPSGKNIHRSKQAIEEDNWGVRPNEGMELELTDEQFEKLLDYWRRRQFGQLEEEPSEQPKAEVDPEPEPQSKQTQPKEPTSNGEEKTEAAESGPFVDRQLKMAIEHLKEELRRKNSAVKKA